MNSYRQSHVGEDAGTKYDLKMASKVDWAIWKNFVEPYTQRELEIAASNGACAYLDFACGTGRILEVGARVFETPTGIDISPDMLAVARSRVPNATLIQSDITRENDAISSQFDCVTMFRFLLNAEPSLRREALSWLGKHMTPGATLVGNTHMNPYSATGAITVAANALGREVNYLSKGSTEKLLLEAGFVVDRWSGFRILPSVLGRPVFGSALQSSGEKALKRLGLGWIGSDQIFVAKRV